jgi:hypothetical protein
MDHLFKELNLSDSKSSDEEYGRAPIEVLSKVNTSVDLLQACLTILTPTFLIRKFLIAVQDRKMTEALGLIEKLIRHEPDNKMFMDYRINIKKYIAEGNYFPNVLCHVIA